MGKNEEKSDFISFHLISIDVRSDGSIRIFMGFDPMHR